jgi:hypothetical protein
MRFFRLVKGNENENWKRKGKGRGMGLFLVFLASSAALNAKMPSPPSYEGVLAVPSTPLSPEESQHFIKEAERYLTGVFSLSAQFQQTTVFKKKKDQEIAPLVQQGQILLCKTPGEPFKIRIDLPNQTLLIVQDCLYTKDLKTQKIRKNSLAATPLSALFEDRVQLRQKFPVQWVAYEEKRHLLFITLKTTSKSSQFLILIFSLYTKNKNIQSLKGWILKDAQRNVTHVAFSEKSLRVNEQSHVDPHFFHFKAPTNIPNPQKNSEQEARSASSEPYRANRSSQAPDRRTRNLSVSGYRSKKMKKSEEQRSAP